MCRQDTSNSDIASNYRLAAKSREWNVFSRVCESFCPRGQGITIWPLPLTHWISLYRPQWPPPDMIPYVQDTQPTWHSMDSSDYPLMYHLLTSWGQHGSQAFFDWWDLNLGSSVQHPEIFTKISNCRQRLIGSKILWTLYQDLKWRTSTDR